MSAVFPVLMVSSFLSCRNKNRRRERRQKNGEKHVGRIWRIEGSVRVCVRACVCVADRLRRYGKPTRTKKVYIYQFLDEYLAEINDEE